MQTEKVGFRKFPLKLMLNYLFLMLHFILKSFNHPTDQTSKYNIQNRVSFCFMSGINECVISVLTVVFPQDLLEKGLAANNFAMLGLGDIVIPGIFIALLLRFDVRYVIKSFHIGQIRCIHCVGNVKCCKWGGRK